MLISEAQQNIDDAIEAFARGSYDTQARREAVAALVADAPCLITIGGYGNQVAARIAGAVNRGEGELADLALAFARSRCFGTVNDNVNGYVLEALVGVNDAGRALLARTAARFAPATQAEAA